MNWIRPSCWSVVREAGGGKVTVKVVVDIWMKAFVNGKNVLGKDSTLL